LAAALYWKVPDPVPVAAPVIVSQLGALDTADQTQPVWVFTEIVPVPPAPATAISGPGVKV
jgi:hypothetical protein